MKLKHFAAATVTFLFVSVGAAGVYAYLTDAEQQTNTLTPQYNEIVPEETFDPPALKEGVNTYQKRVQIKNTGPVPCYIRMRMEFSDSEIARVSGISAENDVFYSALVDGMAKDLTVSGETVIWKDTYLDHLPDGWTYVSEEDDEKLGGYAYWDEVVSPGDATGAFCESVRTFFEDEDSVTSYDIHVYAESVQELDHNGEPFVGDDAWKDAWVEFICQNQ